MSECLNPPEPGTKLYLLFKSDCVFAKESADLLEKGVVVRLGRLRFLPQSKHFWNNMSFCKDKSKGRFRLHSKGLLDQLKKRVEDV